MPPHTAAHTNNGFTASTPPPSGKFPLLPRPCHAEFNCWDCREKKIGGMFDPTYTMYFGIDYTLDSGSEPLRYFIPPFYLQQHLPAKDFHAIEKFMKVIPQDEYETNMQPDTRDSLLLGRSAGTAIYRRYSQFQTLRQLLVILFPMIVIPPLPGKSIMSTIEGTIVTTFHMCGGGVTADVHLEQQRAISRFLNALALEPSVMFCYGVYDFLLTPSEVTSNFYTAEPDHTATTSMSFETLLGDYTNLLHTLTANPPLSLAYINRLRSYVHGSIASNHHSDTKSVASATSGNDCTPTSGTAFLSGMMGGRGVVALRDVIGKVLTFGNSTTNYNDDDAIIRQVLAEVLQDCDSMLSARHCRDAYRKHHALHASVSAYEGVVGSLLRLEASLDASTKLLPDYEIFGSTKLNADAIHAAHQQAPSVVLNTDSHRTNVDKMNCNIIPLLAHEALQYKCLAETIEFYIALTIYHKMGAGRRRRGEEDNQAGNHAAESSDDEDDQECGTCRHHHDHITMDLRVIAGELKKRIVVFEKRHVAVLIGIGRELASIGLASCDVQSEHITEMETQFADVNQTQQPLHSQQHLDSNQRLEPTPFEEGEDFPRLLSTHDFGDTTGGWYHRNSSTTPTSSSSSPSSPSSSA